MELGTLSVWHSPTVLTDGSVITTAILVACLASFRALFTKSNRPSHQRISDEAPKAIKKFAPKVTLLLGSRFAVTSLFDRFTGHTANEITLDDVESPVPQAQTIISASTKDHWEKYDESSRGSAEHILPLNKVHVRHDIATT